MKLNHTTIYIVVQLFCSQKQNRKTNKYFLKQIFNKKNSAGLVVLSFDCSLLNKEHKRALTYLISASSVS